MFSNNYFHLSKPPTGQLGQAQRSRTGVTATAPEHKWELECNTGVLQNKKQVYTDRRDSYFYHYTWLLLHFATTELLPLTYRSKVKWALQAGQWKTVCLVRELFCTWAVHERCEAAKTKQNKTGETEKPVEVEYFSTKTQWHGHDANIRDLLWDERLMFFFLFFNPLLLRAVDCLPVT